MKKKALFCVDEQVLIRIVVQIEVSRDFRRVYHEKRNFHQAHRCQLLWPCGNCLDLNVLSISQFAELCECCFCILLPCIHYMYNLGFLMHSFYVHITPYLFVHFPVIVVLCSDQIGGFFW